MYLEVLIDSQKPVIYKLNKPEIYLGSSTTNDIVISFFGISRKHLKIIVQEKGCLAIDQGSTNGSYIGGAKIVPGKRFELSPLEPLRLGEKVFLTLLFEKGEQVSPLNNSSENLGKTISKSEKTKVISLKELEAAKHKKIENKRKAIHAKKMIEAKRIKEEKESFNKLLKIVFVLMAVGVVLNYSWIFYSEKLITKIYPKKEIAKEVLFEGVDEEGAYKIDRNLLIPVDEMPIHLASVKCRTQEEKHFCQRIPSLKDRPGGALKVEPNLILFIDEGKWLKVARDTLDSQIEKKSLKSEAIDSELIARLIFLNFIKKSMSGLLFASHEKNNFYVVLFIMTANGPEINRVFALKGTMIPILIDKYTDPKMRGKKNFKGFVLGLDEYYQQY